MIYLYKTLIKEEDIIRLYRSNYLAERYDFIVKQCHNNKVDGSILLKFSELRDKYKRESYKIRDELFTKYNIPTSVIGHYKFNLEEDCLDFNFRKDELDD